MKKVAPIFMTLLAAIPLTGQITITAANHTPAIGTSYDLFLVASPNASVSQNGANATWDLSNLSGSASTYNYLNPSAGVDAANFPSATLLQSSTSGGASQELYYSSTSALLSLEGVFQPGAVRAKYTSPRAFTKFPMTFGDTHSSTFSGTTKNLGTPTTFNQTGTVEMEADGYGDLVLPYTTVSNTLRVRLVTSTNLTFQGSPTGTLLDTIYLWYNAGTSHFVASYTISYLNGSNVANQAVYIAQSDLVVSGGGMAISENELNPIELFPNPAKEFLTLKANASLTSIELLTTSGQLVRTFQVGNHQAETFNISDLAKGVYVLRYQDESRIYNDKVIIE